MELAHVLVSAQTNAPVPSSILDRRGLQDGPSAQSYVVLVLTAHEGCVKFALSKMPDRAASGLMCQPF